MTDTNTPASGDPGSAGNGPDNSGTGQPGSAGTSAGPQGNGAQNYAELEKKLGEQGKELGEYRDFVKNLTPLLNKLDAQPELVQAIINDKIDSKLTSAILEGKVKIEEAQQISQAHQAVKQEMGKQAYSQASPEEIERRVLEKAASLLDERLEKRFSDADEQKEFEDKVNSFITHTPDFADYADKIAVWLDEHPDQDDIEVAYQAVKGKSLLDKNAAATQKTAGEQAKGVAANAAGGETTTTGQSGQPDIWDQLVAKRSDPNRL